MNQCDHPIEKISRVDTDGYALDKSQESVYIWGECECGAPTIIISKIESVELDSMKEKLEEPDIDIEYIQEMLYDE